jgi:hypothetical protein
MARLTVSVASRSFDLSPSEFEGCAVHASQDDVLDVSKLIRAPVTAFLKRWIAEVT